MIGSFVASVRSEWLKQKRSLTSWLVMGGGLFVPGLVLAIRVRQHAILPEIYRTADFWPKLWGSLWESMSLVILPVVIILAASLITQIEYRNNTWKQLHASPQPLATIFLAKLVIILAMVVRLILWFELGIFLTGMIPVLLFRGVRLPPGTIPFGLFFRRDLDYFIDALPIAAIQYLLALRFRNFMVPVGVGMALWIAAIGGLSWQYNYLIPYAYVAIDYTTTIKSQVSHALPASTQTIAACVFVGFTLAAYVLYVTKNDRG